MQHQPWGRGSSKPQARTRLRANRVYMSIPESQGRGKYSRGDDRLSMPCTTKKFKKFRFVLALSIAIGNLYPNSEPGSEPANEHLFVRCSFQARFRVVVGPDAFVAVLASDPIHCQGGYGPLARCAPCACHGPCGVRRLCDARHAWEPGRRPRSIVGTVGRSFRSWDLAAGRPQAVLWAALLAGAVGASRSSGLRRRGEQFGLGLPQLPHSGSRTGAGFLSCRRVSDLSHPTGRGCLPSPALISSFPEAA
jgi:hypothetical protein